MFISLSKYWAYIYILYWNYSPGVWVCERQEPPTDVGEHCSESGGLSPPPSWGHCYSMAMDDYFVNCELLKKVYPPQRIAVRVKWVHRYKLFWGYLVNGPPCTPEESGAYSKSSFKVTGKLESQPEPRHLTPRQREKTVHSLCSTLFSVCHMFWLPPPTFRSLSLSPLPSSLSLCLSSPHSSSLSLETWRLGNPPPTPPHPANITCAFFSFFLFFLRREPPAFSRLQRHLWPPFPRGWTWPWQRPFSTLSRSWAGAQRSGCIPLLVFPDAEERGRLGQAACRVKMIASWRHSWGFSELSEQAGGLALHSWARGTAWAVESQPGRTPSLCGPRFTCHFLRTRRESAAFDLP